MYKAALPAISVARILAGAIYGTIILALLVLSIIL